jgi:peptidoglycan hydrolase CwlO-like protein
MSVEQALSSVNDMITKLSNLSRIDKSQSDDLRQLKDDLEKLQTTYADLSPYKKIIKLFEVWRMINDA